MKNKLLQTLLIPYTICMLNNNVVANEMVNEMVNEKNNNNQSLGVNVVVYSLCTISDKEEIACNIEQNYLIIKEEKEIEGRNYMIKTIYF